MAPQEIPVFEVLQDVNNHEFAIPKKCIHEGSDLPLFHVSHAYHDILAFLVRLNRVMFPSVRSQAGSDYQSLSTHSQEESFSPPVKHLRALLQELTQLIEEAPPDPGPRRFGNVSFRVWNRLLEERSLSLLQRHLKSVLPTFNATGKVSPLDEINAYLLGSFGSAQRLDYGTGHELSFLAFLGCIWKIGGFGREPSVADSRDIVIGVIQPYLQLSRKLILTYNLEPAGSHGVWGLDDHSFLPYIFGSAQYGPATKLSDPTPVEGSLNGAPDPASITSSSVVERERNLNMYFGAIGFINDVKKGPFWEHSPTLYDISGVRAGWGKINKGMLKMYDAEVLGKFPVVQHFPFGSLFNFDKDPLAKAPIASIHASSQPEGQSTQSSTSIPSNLSSTKAPWAKSSNVPATQRVPTNAQRPLRDPRGENQAKATNKEKEDRAALSGSMPPPTRAPWAK